MDDPYDEPEFEEATPKELWLTQHHLGYVMHYTKSSDTVYDIQYFGILEPCKNLSKWMHDKGFRSANTNEPPIRLLTMLMQCYLTRNAPEPILTKGL